MADLTRKEKKDLKNRQKDCAELLCSAIRRQDAAGLRRILSGPERDFIELKGGNAYLHLAVASSTPEILDTLLKAGADPRTGASSSESDRHKTPLRLAIELDKIEIARVLFDDPRTEDPGREMLIHADLDHIYVRDVAPSARELAANCNRHAAWTELFDLVEARRFMEKFNRAKAVLEKHGELPRPSPEPDAPKPPQAFKL
jgi:hypothetical protein